MLLFLLQQSTINTSESSSLCPVATGNGNGWMIWMASREGIKGSITFSLASGSSEQSHPEVYNASGRNSRICEFSAITSRAARLTHISRVDERLPRRGETLRAQLQKDTDVAVAVAVAADDMSRRDWQRRSYAEPGDSSAHAQYIKAAGDEDPVVRGHRLTARQRSAPAIDHGHEAAPPCASSCRASCWRWRSACVRRCRGRRARPTPCHETGRSPAATGLFPRAANSQ